MSHSHHGHGHHHHHSSSANSHNTAFALAVSLNAAFVLIEAGYALYANSMSLLADAGHNLGDVMGLGLAWLASWLLTRKASARYSYGYKKTTILAALLNAVLLLSTTLIIAIESIQKLWMPNHINESVMIWVAAIGIVINGSTALLFWRGHETDLNLKASFLHLAMDALISLGVVFTGIIIYFTKCWILDPLMGLVIVATILFSTWTLLRDSVNLILDGVPHSISKAAVETYLSSLTGVTAVHDLHIWGLSTRETALTAHLVMPGSVLSDADFLTINEHLLHQFQIAHVTIQVEQGSTKDPCGQTKTC